MKKPEKPIPSDCCGQGCTPCVYERYAHQMVIYEEWLREEEQKKTANKEHELTLKKSKDHSDE